MITKGQKKHLRSLAHDSKPIIWIGQHGLSTNVIEELNSALDHHELVKIKLRVGEREERDKLIADISEKTKAILVKKIGNTAIFFRRNEEQPVITLPKK